MREFEGISRECFYGQLVGLHYTPSIRNVMKVTTNTCTVRAIVCGTMILLAVLFCIRSDYAKNYVELMFET